MTWLNWSLKLHSRLRTIPHLIHTHTTHMPNVQWMSYSFVRLYLSKCDVCVLNLIWINPKRFLIILYVFGSDFYHFLCLCLVLTLFFNVWTCSGLKKNKCQIFWPHILATCVSCQQAASFGWSVWRLASRESKPRVQTERFRGSLATWLATRQSRVAQNKLFKELFRGKLVLNLSHPL